MAVAETMEGRTSPWSTELRGEQQKLGSERTGSEKNDTKGILLRWKLKQREIWDGVGSSTETTLKMSLLSKVYEIIIGRLKGEQAHFHSAIGP